MEDDTGLSPFGVARLKERISELERELKEEKADGEALEKIERGLWDESFPRNHSPQSIAREALAADRKSFNPTEMAAEIFKGAKPSTKEEREQIKRALAADRTTETDDEVE